MARKRELIDTGTDKRYVRRNKLGTSFVKSDDVGRSLAADRRRRAKTKSSPAKATKATRRAQSAKQPAKTVRRPRVGTAPLGSLPPKKGRGAVSEPLTSFPFRWSSGSQRTRSGP